MSDEAVRDVKSSYLKRLCERSRCFKLEVTLEAIIDRAQHIAQGFSVTTASG